MIKRVAFLLVGTVVVSCCLVIAIWFANLFFVAFSPSFNGFITIAFFGMAIALGVWSILRFRDKDDDNNATQSYRVLRLFCTFIPAAVAVWGGLGLIERLTPFWTLPSQPSEVVSSLPAEKSLVSFRSDGKILLAEIDSGALFEWQTEPAKNHEQVVDKGFCLYRKQLIGTNGRSYDLDLKLGEPPFARDLDVISDGSNIVWRVLYADTDEEKGVWIRPISNNEDATKFSPFGWQPIWSQDGETPFLCTGQGLAKIESGETIYLFETKAEHYVRDPELSPDGNSIVFRIEDMKKGITTRDRICVVSLDGELTELFVTEPGGHADKPQWAPNGEQIAFRYTPPANQKYRVRTLVVTDREGKSTKTLAQFESGTFLTPSGVQDFSWSPDSKRIAFLASLRGATLLENEGGTTSHKFDLYLIHADGTGFRRLTALKQEFQTSNSDPVIWW